MMVRNQRDLPQSDSVIADPSACAAMTGTDIVTTNMEDGSADNTLANVGATNTGDVSTAIEQNFDKIADEINALNDDCGALKTAIDANKTAIDSVIDCLVQLGIIPEA